MTETAPDNQKKRRQFILTSAMDLVFLIILALYVRFLLQPGAADGSTTASALSQFMYVIAPPAFGLIGLLLAIVWKPLSRGVIVLLALHYVLTLSILLLVGYANVTLLIGQFRSSPSNTLILLGLLAVLVFVSFWNIKSLKDLDLPSTFGKR